MELCMRSKLYQIGIRHLLLMQEFVVIALTDKDEKTCAHIAMELTESGICRNSSVPTYCLY